MAKFQKLHETDEYLYMCMNHNELERGKKKNKPRIMLDDEKVNSACGLTLDISVVLLLCVFGMVMHF